MRKLISGLISIIIILVSILVYAHFVSVTRYINLEDTNLQTISIDSINCYSVDYTTYRVLPGGETCYIQVPSINYTVINASFTINNSDGNTFYHYIDVGNDGVYESNGTLSTSSEVNFFEAVAGYQENITLNEGVRFPLPYDSTYDFASYGRIAFNGDIMYTTTRDYHRYPAIGSKPTENYLFMINTSSWSLISNYTNATLFLEADFDTSFFTDFVYKDNYLYANFVDSDNNLALVVFNVSDNKFNYVKTINYSIISGVTRGGGGGRFWYPYWYLGKPPTFFQKDDLLFSFSDYNITVFNISNPLSIGVISNQTIGTNYSYIKNAYYKDDTGYLVMDNYAMVNTNPGCDDIVEICNYEEIIESYILILNMTNINSINLMGYYNSTSDGTSFRNIVYHDNYIYLGPWRPDWPLLVYNVTNRSNIALVTKYYTNQSNTNGMTYLTLDEEHDILYSTAMGLSIKDPSNPYKVEDLDILSCYGYGIVGTNYCGSNNEQYWPFLHNNYLYAIFQGDPGTMGIGGSQLSKRYDTSYTKHSYSEIPITLYINTTVFNITNINITLKYDTSDYFQVNNTKVFNTTSNNLVNSQYKKRIKFFSKENVYNNLTIQGYRRNDSITACEIDNVAKTVSSDYCVYSEVIPASSAWPTHYYYDNTFSETVAINMSNSTTVSGNTLYQTLSLTYNNPDGTAAPSGTFTNATLTVYYNMSVRQNQKLEVNISNTWYDITPSYNLCPNYEKKTQGGRNFYTCLNTTDYYFSIKVESSN